MRRLWSIALTVFLVAGCEEKPSQPTVFDEQLKARDKARAVEGQLREAAERRVEEAESSGY